ncbi:hypothetical protein FRC07_006276 [Ceratobasidium sp. 392]|nr:hypothetical protein FRC07_006276 [Ceratobasidium sp. 392]
MASSFLARTEAAAHNKTTHRKLHLSDDPGVGEAEDSVETFCFVCDDGEFLIDCTICGKPYCYGIIGDQSPNRDDSPCVTIPASMASETGDPFPCPECLSAAQARTAPYIINRGARKTMKMKPACSVILVVFHIESLTQQAISIYEQIQAALGVFRINVAAFCGFLHGGLSQEDEMELRQQLADDSEFQLIVVFVTESHPGGGWWSRSSGGPDGKGEQADEGQMLQFFSNNVRFLARKALSVRYFGVACGWNLPGSGVIEAIRSHLASSRVLSLVLPTTSAVLSSDFSHILPELMLNLYYFGSELRYSLYKVWGRSEEVRKHTGILVMDRDAKDSSFRITKLLHSPSTSRPMGVDLPVYWSVCGCDSSLNDDEAWVSRDKELVHGRESFFVYRSACCNVVLQVAIFPSRRRVIEKNDTLFTEEDWNAQTRRFDFQQSLMVRMKTFPPPREGQVVPLVTDAPWTIAGRVAAAKQSSNAVMQNSAPETVQGLVPAGPNRSS